MRRIIVIVVLLLVGFTASPFILLFIASSCDTNTATISNRSGSAVLATIQLRGVLVWRGKIESEQTTEAVYRTVDDGYPILFVELSDKKLQAGGGLIFSAPMPDEFVIEPARVVNTTPPPTFSTFEVVRSYCVCAIRSMFGPDPPDPKKLR